MSGLEVIGIRGSAGTSWLVWDNDTEESFAMFLESKESAESVMRDELERRNEAAYDRMMDDGRDFTPPYEP